VTARPRRVQDAANNALLLQRLAARRPPRAFVSTLVAVRHADDPEPLVACGRWPGEILRRAARAGRLRLRPADVHPGAGRQRGRTRRRGEEPPQPPRAGRGADARAACARPGPLADAAPIRLHYLRPGTLQLAALPPLSLYVHLPWCLKKCPYCDFNSHHEVAPAARDLPEARYLDALRADLEAALPLVWGRRVVQRLHRRRHAQPVLARRHRPAAGRHPRAAAAGARLRDHAGGQPRHLRARPLPRLPRRRRHAAVDRRAELRRRRCCSASAACTTPRRRAPRSPRRRGLRHLQHRPDVRAAGADAGRAAARPGQALAFAPPHLSIYHLTIEPNTPSR
jgi:hypothetical protein